jgi:chemotaxis protein CheX
VKADLINPFLAAAFNVLKRMGRTEATRGKLGLVSSPVHGDEVNVTVGVTGDLLGQVIFCMAERTVMKLASNMLMGLPVAALDELTKSAICEFSNVVTGNAVGELGDLGFICNITPPTIFVGRDVTVSAAELDFLVIPLQTDFGDIKIYIALKEAKG